MPNGPHVLGRNHLIHVSQLPGGRLCRCPHSATTKPSRGSTTGPASGAQQGRGLSPGDGNQRPQRPAHHAGLGIELLPAHRPHTGSRLMTAPCGIPFHPDLALTDSHSPVSWCEPSPAGPGLTVLTSSQNRPHAPGCFPFRGCCCSCFLVLPGGWGGCKEKQGDRLWSWTN